MLERKKSYGLLNKAFGGENCKLNWLLFSVPDISLFVSLCFCLSPKQDTHKQSKRNMDRELHKKLQDSSQ